MADIFQNGSADVYSVKTKEGKTIMFPALDDLILKIDTINKIIELDKKRFSEVAVYED
jgi:ribosomal 30S subunit maturation factor RimM